MFDISIIISDLHCSYAERTNLLFSNTNFTPNPYKLADDIWGIGFKTADTIATKLRMKKDSYVRTRSGIIYTLNQLCDDGHCYARRDQLVEAAVKILDVEEPIIQMILDDMIFR